MRKFIRHPADVPVKYAVLDSKHTTLPKTPMKNIGQGGLCFTSSTPLDKGMHIRLEIQIRVPPFQAEACVAWCKKIGGEYEIGVRFVDENAEFNLRMVEQVCQIEHYKKEVLEREGRKLSHEQAAEEWINRYASNFPR